MSAFDPEYVRKQYLEHLSSNGVLNLQQLMNGGGVGQQNQNNLNGDNQIINQNSENQSPIINNNNNQNDQKQNDQINQEQDQPLFIPRFLEKFSNTFFRKTDPKMNPNEYYQQKQKEWESKQEEKKQKQQLKKTTTKQTNKDSESKKITDTKQLVSSKRIVNDKHGRSASSIVFDYNSFSQSSSSKFGFANELLTSLKQGASNILMNIKGSMHLSQQGIELDKTHQTNKNQQDDQMQIPNTESDELYTIQNRGISNNGVIEFETEESERQQKQTKNNKKNKEEHISIFFENSNQNQRDGQQNGSLGNKQQLGVFFSGNSNKKNQGNSHNQQILYLDSQDSNQDQQQNDLKLIKEPSEYDEEGQLNTIIEEKSILDHTNNNNIINFLNNQQQDIPQGQKMRNLSQYNMQYETIQSKSPKNFLYEQNSYKRNKQDIFNQQENELQDSNNPNQHRRFFSAQLSHQINFNRQPSISQNQETPKKQPLQTFDEENSIMNESQQSQSKQDQSSMMSCSRMDKSSNTCLVCFDKQPDSVFMDCGHGGVCYECALEIWKKTSECYLCRLKIVQVLQVDLKSKVYGLIKVISSTQMVQKEVDESELSSQNNQHLEEIEEDIQE